MFISTRLAASIAYLATAALCLYALAVTCG